MNIENDLIEGAEAAAGILGLTKRQIYYMVAKNRLPSTRIGNRLFFRKSELERTFSANDNGIDFDVSAMWPHLIKGAKRHGQKRKNAR